MLVMLAVGDGFVKSGHWDCSIFAFSEQHAASSAPGQDFGMLPFVVFFWTCPFQIWSVVCFLPNILPAKFYVPLCAFSFWNHVLSPMQKEAAPILEPWLGSACHSEVSCSFPHGRLNRNEALPCPWRAHSAEERWDMYFCFREVIRLWESL